MTLDPQFAMAYGRIGYAYAVTGYETERAKPYLEKAFQFSSRLTEKDRLYINAWYLIANLDYASATVPLKQIITRYPMEVEAYLRLSYLLRGEGQHDEAINVLKQALVIDPEARDVYNALGLAYLDLRRFEEAIVAHQRYVQLAPAESNAYDSLGMSYQSAGRYAEALTAYEQALTLRPDNWVTSFHLGNAYVQLGRYQAALAQYHRVVQMTSDRLVVSRSYGLIAETYLKKGDLKQAVGAARMEYPAGKHNVWNSLVIALKRGDKSTSGKLRAQLFAQFQYTYRGQNFPKRLSLYQRGYLSLRDGQTEEAIAVFKEALQHPPVLWMIDSLEDCLASAFSETGHLDEAISEYERILRLNQNYPLAHYRLAQAYERKGLFEPARAEYERFLQVWKNADSDIPEVVAAKKALENSSS